MMSTLFGLSPSLLDYNSCPPPAPNPTLPSLAYLPPPSMPKEDSTLLGNTTDRTYALDVSLARMDYSCQGFLWEGIPSYALYHLLCDVITRQYLPSVSLPWIVVLNGSC
eukprot:15332003-Ditylum_brightwellii.AAC.1